MLRNYSHWTLAVFFNGHFAPILFFWFINWTRISVYICLICWSDLFFCLEMTQKSQMQDVSLCIAIFVKNPELLFLKIGSEMLMLSWATQIFLQKLKIKPMILNNRHFLLFLSNTVLPIHYSNDDKTDEILWNHQKKLYAFQSPRL